jgi:hypothetical protein
VHCLQGIQEMWGKEYTLRDICGLGTDESDVFMVLNVVIQWHESVSKSEATLLSDSDVFKVLFSM